MNSPYVSIIVPVYNAETNLKRCIDSVLKQDFEKFELLLVDDGSTDASGMICDTYAKQDPRIRVIHQKNSGVSAARNAAMGQARGTYLQFLDSDDWITPDATGLLYRMAEENDCELVISDFYRVIEERLAPKGDIQEQGVLSRKELAAYMMENPADFYYGVLWNKLYRSDIIRSLGLQMDPELHWCEDFLFNMEYIRHIRQVYVLKVPIYYYVKTKGSLVSQAVSLSNMVKMKRSVFQSYHDFYKDIFEEEDYEKNRLQMYRFLVDVAGDGTVAPAFLPGAMKLGDERISISVGAVESTGIQMDLYRERKLLERFLETVALKQDMSLEEIKLLLHISQAEEGCSLKEIAQALHLSKARLWLVIQRLLSREILVSQELSHMEGKRQLHSRQFDSRVELELTDFAQEILRELEIAGDNYRRTMFAGFTQEELEQYEMLREKRRCNIKRALQ
ncbi:MAG: glycosyltransferase [Lachnospiraceae bacterium]|nr:glycosyltransferase [Lachnospiraceae bacterium]